MAKSSMASVMSERKGGCRLDLQGMGQSLMAAAASVDEVEAWYNPLENRTVFDGAFGVGEA
jgi:hypothetical protein